MDITYIEKDGLKLKTKRGSVVIGHDGVATVTGKDAKTPFVISQPGEYEVEGISVFGYGQEGKTLLVVQVEELRVLYVPGLTSPINEKLLEDLDSIDVVAAPGELEPKIFVQAVGAVEPSYVLPLGESRRDELVKLFEHGSREATSLALARATLPQETTEVVVLSA